MEGRRSRSAWVPSIEPITRTSTVVSANSRRAEVAWTLYRSTVASPALCWAGLSVVLLVMMGVAA